MLHTLGAFISNTGAELWGIREATTGTVPFSNDITSTPVRITNSAHE